MSSLTSSGSSTILSENPDLALAECWYWIRKLQARFFAGDYAAALEASQSATAALDIAVTSSKRRSIISTVRFPRRRPAIPRRPTSDGSIWRLWPRTIDSSRSGRRIALRISRTAPRWWAPRSLASKAAISTPKRLYEQAIRSARANGFVHNEALANELRRAFYVARGFEKFAHVYLRNARYGYLRWGADGKVRQLDELYPHLKEEEPEPARRARLGRRSNIWTSRR